MRDGEEALDDVRVTPLPGPRRCSSRPGRGFGEDWGVFHRLITDPMTLA
ncbi:MAG: hypothetical protein R3F43_09760 [bacterium]